MYVSVPVTVCCSIIDKQDGVRLLWSLLKSPNPEVVNIYHSFTVVTIIRSKHVLHGLFVLALKMLKMLVNW